MNTESNLSNSCPRRRFVEPPDNLPMPAPAGYTKGLEDLMIELRRRVKDNTADKERHGSLKTYDIEHSKERKLHPTHHKESSVLDGAYQGEVTKLHYEAHKGYVLKLAIKDTDKEPPEEHDDQDQDKLFMDVTEVPEPRQRAMEEQNMAEDHRTREEGEIAPLDASYPTMRVSSDDEKQQTNHRMSTMHENIYKEDVKNKTYRENRSCVKNVVVTALHHTRDCQTRMTSTALTLMRRASQRQGAGGAPEDQDDPLRHGGGGGHN
jgi:hypothetical protein